MSHAHAKYEITLAFGRRYNSSYLLLEHCLAKDGPVFNLLGFSVGVAPLRILYLLKKSHIHWDHQFDKHMRDLQFLRSKLIESKENPEFNEDEKYILYLRIQEKKERDGDPAGHIHLNQSADDFLEYDDKLFVKKYIRHDDIHDLVAFEPNQPLYKRILITPEKAMCSEKKFNELSQEERLNDVREEAMVIAMERKILPAYSDDSQFSYRNALQRICTNLTKGWFREFAVDNYSVLLQCPKDLLMIAQQLQE